jgi:hypothetical protein
MNINVNIYHVPANAVRKMCAPVSKGGDLVDISMPADSEDSYFQKRPVSLSRWIVLFGYARTVASEE